MPNDDTEPYMDEADIEWLKSFTSLPEGAVVEGFITVVSYIKPNGELGWKSYNALNRPLSYIVGLLQMTQFTMITDNLVPIDED